MTESPIETIAAAPAYLDEVDLEKTPLPKLVEELTKDMSRLDRLASPEAEKEFYEHKLAKARQHYAFEGVLSDKAAGVAREAADAARTRYQERVKRDAEMVLKVAPLFEQKLEQWIANGRRLPTPAYGDTRRGLELQERQELRLRYNGRPLRELVLFYEHTPDAASGGDPVRFIEDEYRAGWPTLQPANDGEADASAFIRLKTAIGERETKRVPTERIKALEAFRQEMRPTRKLLLRQLAGQVPAMVG